MQRLGLNEDLELNENTEVKEVEREEKFWKRQFQTNPTGSQKRFDWLFGVILPVICFTFDPIVFSSREFLGDYKTFAYILSFVSVMAMSAWLIWGAQLKWLNAFLAGLFIVGAIVSLSIGIVILPISLIGLVVLIGALGFTPLFSAMVFLRNSLRAYRAAGLFLERKVLVYTFLLAALFSAIVPPVINVEINKLKREKQTGYFAG